MHWKRPPPPIRNFDRLSFPLLFCREKKSFSLSLSSSSFCHLPLTAGEYKDDPDKQIGRHTFSPAHPNERKREEKRFFLKEKKADLGIGGWSLGWSREGLLCVYYVVQYSISFLLLSCFHILLRFLNEVSRCGHAGLVYAMGPMNGPFLIWKNRPRGEGAEFANLVKTKYSRSF